MAGMKKRMTTQISQKIKNGRPVFAIEWSYKQKIIYHVINLEYDLLGEFYFDIL